MNGNLADMIINQMERGEDVNNTHWGIDETGLPWPNPVNADAIVARLFSKYGRDGIFKIQDGLFINRKMVKKDKSTLLALCGKPQIVIWADDEHDYAEFWAQIKKVISTEWPIIWATVMEYSDEYNNDYIRVSGTMVWDKNKSDIITERKDFYD